MLMGQSGTNTDAVLLDGTKSGSDAVLGTYKATTGTDVTTGIEEAIRTLLNDAHVPPSDIASLMIGTTVCSKLLQGDREPSSYCS